MDGKDAKEREVKKPDFVRPGFRKSCNAPQLSLYGKGIEVDEDTGIPKMPKGIGLGRKVGRNPMQSPRASDSPEPSVPTDISHSSSILKSSLAPQHPQSATSSGATQSSTQTSLEQGLSQLGLTSSRRSTRTTESIGAKSKSRS